jgi:tol-pal system protein YbgF
MSRLSFFVPMLLLVATPAMAQRASLADRVAALEQQAANNQGNVDLLNQVTALKSDVQSLRAQTEDLQHQVEQLKQGGHDQYLDLDGRLSRLEGGRPAQASSASSAPIVASRPLASPTPRDTPPVVHGDAGTIAAGADERSNYQAAFDTLKAGQYAEASRQFQDFLQRYPAGTYAPNALYWLGESYYATRNYAPALDQFQTLLGRYPTHDKAPGALLKVGLSQYNLKRLDDAQATFKQVMQRYPGTDVARAAADSLRAIELQQTH